jgi:hypothetical protein
MMNKILSIFAGVLFLLSSATFAAEQHGAAALEHANAAVEQGKANNTTELIKHANVALEHTLAAALATKGKSQRAYGSGVFGTGRSCEAWPYASYRYRYRAC